MQAVSLLICLLLKKQETLTPSSQVCVLGCGQGGYLEGILEVFICVYISVYLRFCAAVSITQSSMCLFSFFLRAHEFMDVTLNYHFSSRSHPGLSSANMAGLAEQLRSPSSALMTGKLTSKASSISPSPTTTTPEPVAAALDEAEAGAMGSQSREEAGSMGSQSSSTPSHRTTLSGKSCKRLVYSRSPRAQDQPTQKVCWIIMS